MKVYCVDFKGCVGNIQSFNNKELSELLISKGIENTSRLKATYNSSNNTIFVYPRTNGISGHELELTVK